MLDFAAMCLRHRSLFATLSAALSPVLLAGVLLSALSCGPAEPVKGAWHWTSLLGQKPVMDVNSPDAGERRQWHRVVTYLGPKEVRDRRIVHPSSFENVPELTSGEILALRQLVNSRLKWTVELGEDPYLSFIPLRNQQHRLPFVYRVLVREEAGGPETLIFETEAGALVPPAQATEYVDLSKYAGKTIELLFELLPPRRMVRPAPRARGLWGSPGIYSRKAWIPPAPQEKPNVLLIGADTLRADALGAYGANPSVTPGLDRLAAQSDVWTEAISSYNVTNPSFVSLMTGLYGKNHGVYDLSTPLPEDETTLAELFQGAGYETLAVISARHLGPHGSGLGQGFDEVALAEHHNAAEHAVNLTMGWISERRKPFFAWLHLFDPHTPHTPPAPYGLGFRPDQAYGLSPPEKWEIYRNPGWVPYVHASLGGQKDLYAGEVAYMDHQVDRLLDFLESRGLLENTIVVFISDHGENLEDHGILYGHHGLWDTTVHVPLMIRWPGAKPEGRRIDGFVQNVDVFPTLAAAAGLDAPETDGQDLRTMTEEGRRRRVAFSEHAHQSGTRVRTEEFAYMVSHGNPFLEDGAYLYDLREDPEELENLAGTGHPQEAELDRILRGWLADRRGGDRPVPVDLSEEDVQRLKALGYL